MSFNLANVQDSQYIKPGYHKVQITRLEISNEKSTNGAHIVEIDFKNGAAINNAKLFVTEKSLSALKSFMQAINLNIPNVDYPTLDDLMLALKGVFATVNKMSTYPIIFKGSESSKDGKVYANLGFSPYNAAQAGMTIPEGDFEEGSTFWTKF